jgi:archaellum biogenesis ATPase FlaH
MISGELKMHPSEISNISELSLDEASYSVEISPKVEKKSESKLNGLELLYNLTTTDDLMKKIENAELIWGTLIVKGHFVVISAKPNGGKTTLFTHCAKELSEEGYQVLYINVDAAGSEIKSHHEHAKKYQYKVIAPDIHEGRSVEDVTQALEEISSSGKDLSDIVLILDTLKKFVDVIDKRRSKKFYGTLRRMTAKGATIIALAHTNKWDVDDQPIYEGTGDLKADVDELIYLVSVIDTEGNQLVSAIVDKKKSNASNMTFCIEKDTRNVSVMDTFLDTVKILSNQKQYEKDSPIIDWILTKLSNGNKSSFDLQKEGSMEGIGSRSTIKSVLFRYSDESGTVKPYFTKSKGKTKGWTFGIMTESYSKEIYKDNF